MLIQLRQIAEQAREGLISREQAMAASREVGGIAPKLIEWAFDRGLLALLIAVLSLFHDYYEDSSKADPNAVTNAVVEQLKTMQQSNEELAKAHQDEIERLVREVSELRNHDRSPQADAGQTRQQRRAIERKSRKRSPK